MSALVGVARVDGGWGVEGRKLANDALPCVTRGFPMEGGWKPTDGDKHIHCKNKNVLCERLDADRHERQCSCDDGGFLKLASTKAFGPKTNAPSKDSRREDSSCQQTKIGDK